MWVVIVCTSCSKGFPVLREVYVPVPLFVIQAFDERRGELHTQPLFQTDHRDASYGLTFPWWGVVLQ